MAAVKIWLWLALGLLTAVLPACGNVATSVGTSPTLASMAVPPTAVTLPAPHASNTPLPTAVSSPTALPPTAMPPTALPPTAAPPTAVPPTNPPPSPTADPYAAYTIAALAARSYGGGELQIVDTLESNDTFTRYLVTYPSDGLTIYGFMNVPHDGQRFPVALVLHGYVDPAVYDTVAYTRRYADDLAQAGFLVIHPNFRNHPPSDVVEGPDPFRTGYASDVLNLIAIVRQQSQDPSGVLRRADADNIHLWGHSMGGGVALRVLAVNKEAYLRTAVLYAAMSGDERLNYERIQDWTNGRVGAFELAASPEALAAISPIYHLAGSQTAVSIHHSDADDVVPLAWSEALCAQLQAANHPVECFTYEGLPHTFRGLGDAQFMERVRLFMARHSN